MLLDRVDVGMLHHMLKPHMSEPAWPGLTQGHASAELKRRARRLGIWESLERRAAADGEIAALRYSLYRRYRREGERKACDAFMSSQRLRLRAEALAVWLQHPRASLDAVQDWLWALCDQHTWVMTAHYDCFVDLGSSATAAQLAEILWVLDGRLEQAVRERVRGAVYERVLDRVSDYRRIDDWATNPMNWNHVCNANAIIAALYLEPDARRLAILIHPLIQHLDYALQGFSEDGGCREGPGYWDYGFGHFMDAALVLYHRSGGALNLMQEERVQRICRYPLAAYIDGEVRTSFADSRNGRLEAMNALKVNRFHKMPALYGICARREDGALAVEESWRALALYGGEVLPDAPPDGDYVLPNMGQAVLRAGDGKTVLAALAGDNGVPHNHNDVGSFIYSRHGRCVLTDPGSPRYTAKTFSARRYEILYCRSRGHSVPLINGREQKAGTEYAGTLRVSADAGSDAKRATIEMAGAYGEPALKRLTRELKLGRDGALELVDAFEFARAPQALEEAFVTYETVVVEKSGASVCIGKGRKHVTLRCIEGEGCFSVEVCTDDLVDGHGEVPVKRIRFVPRTLGKTMRLAFRVE